MSMQMISRRLATTLIAASFLLLIPASVMADEFGGTWVSASANGDPTVCLLEGPCPSLAWQAGNPTLLSNYYYSWNYNETNFSNPFAPLGPLQTATFTVSGQEVNSTYSLGAEISMGVGNWGSLNNSYWGPELFSASAQAELWLTDPSFFYNGGANGLPQNGYLDLTLNVAGSGNFVLDYYNENYSQLPQSVGFNSNPGTVTLDVPFSLCDPVIAVCGPPDIELALNVLAMGEPDWTDQNVSFSSSSDYLDTVTVASAAVYDANGNLIQGATFDGLPTTPPTVVVPEPGSCLLLVTVIVGFGAVRRLRLRRT
jgi:hypothetical protein